MKTVSLVCGALLCHGASLPDPLKHDVMSVNERNKGDVFGHKYLDAFPGLIMYYRDQAAAAKVLDDVLDPLAKDLRGMIRIGAVDCKEQANLCRADLSQDELAKEYALRIYPTMPLPSFEYTGKLEKAKLRKALVRLIQPGQYSTIKTVQEAEKFFATDPNLPKVLFWHPQNAVATDSTVWNALTHTFGDRMVFGFAGKDADPAILKKLGLKKGPALLVKTKDTKLSARNTEVKTSDLNFGNLREWLNVHSETFARGGGIDITIKQEEKPWLDEPLPQLTKLSQKDVCFNLPSGAFCAVYAVDSEEGPSEAVRDMLVALKNSIKKPALSYTWLDLSAEPEFRKQLGDLKPKSFTIINPKPNRIRFTTLDSALTSSDIINFIEAVKNGDQRFKPLKGTPTFAPLNRTKQPKSEL